MRIRPWLLILALGIIAYQNSFSSSFLFDDKYAILENPAIRSLWPLRESTMPDIRPVVTLSLALNYALGGLQVWGYHALNLAIHLFSALVLWGIVRRTLELPRLQKRFAPSAMDLATAISVLWVVHPFQTQSVNYIIQRAELLMGLFYLLTLYALIRSAGSRHPQRWFAAGILACALGMGSKSIMVTAPILLLLYDRIFLSSSFRQALDQRRFFYGGLAATWGISLLFLWTLRNLPVPSFGFALKQLTWQEYLRTQPGVLLQYLKLSFWPHPLVFDYHWPVANRPSEIWPPAAAIGGLLLASLWALRRNSAAGFLGAWFFLILAPTSSFIPVADLAVEHRMYLPLAAVVSFVILGGYRLGLRGKAATGLVTACAVGLTSGTALRNRDYRDEVSIWSDSLQKRPGNHRAHNNLGIALAKQEKFEEAIAQFTEAFRLDPEYAEAYYNCGVAFAGRKEYEESISLYHRAIQLKPHYPDAYDSWGHALAHQGNIEQAIPFYIQALRIKPDFLLARHHLEKSVTILRKELESSPKNPQLHNALGVGLAGLWNFEEAFSHFEEALRIQPQSVQTHNNWGVALADHGNLPEAASHFREALRLDPNDPAAQENLDLALKLQRNPLPDTPSYRIRVKRKR